MNIPCWNVGNCDRSICPFQHVDESFTGRGEGVYSPVTGMSSVRRSSRDLHALRTDKKITNDEKPKRKNSKRPRVKISVDEPSAFVDKESIDIVVKPLDVVHEKHTDVDKSFTIVDDKSNSDAVVEEVTVGDELLGVGDNESIADDKSIPDVIVAPPDIVVDDQTVFDESVTIVDEKSNADAVVEEAKLDFC